jgi:hypothetical protein
VGTPGGSIMSTYLSQTNAGHTSHFYLRQKIESVTTLAGQTATLTVRLQSSVDFSIDPTLFQDFGTGGSAGVTVNSNEGAQAVTSGGIRTLSWTFAIPDISGKAVDAINDSLHVNLISTAAVNGTIQWIAAQFEPGPVATPFEYRPIGTELALCQRYYQKVENIRTLGLIRPDGANTGFAFAYLPFPVQMRAIPAVASVGTWDTTQGNETCVPDVASEYGVRIRTAANDKTAGAVATGHGGGYTADAEL